MSALSRISLPPATYAGPVLIDLPKDVLNRTTTWRTPVDLNLPGYKPSVQGHPKQVQAAIDMIHSSERPVLSGV